MRRSDPRSLYIALLVSAVQRCVDVRRSLGWLGAETGSLPTGLRPSNASPPLDRSDLHYRTFLQHVSLGTQGHMDFGYAESNQYFRTRRLLKPQGTQRVGKGLINQRGYAGWKEGRMQEWGPCRGIPRSSSPGRVQTLIRSCNQLVTFAHHSSPSDRHMRPRRSHSWTHTCYDCRQPGRRAQGLRVYRAQCSSGSYL